METMRIAMGANKGRFDSALRTPVQGGSLLYQPHDRSFLDLPYHTAVSSSQLLTAFALSLRYSLVVFPFRVVFLAESTTKLA